MASINNVIGWTYIGEGPRAFEMQPRSASPTCGMRPPSSGNPTPRRAGSTRVFAQASNILKTDYGTDVAEARRHAAGMSEQSSANGRRRQERHRRAEDDGRWPQRGAACCRQGWDLRCVADDIRSPDAVGAAPHARPRARRTLLRGGLRSAERHRARRRAWSDRPGGLLNGWTHRPGTVRRRTGWHRRQGGPDCSTTRYETFVDFALDLDYMTEPARPPASSCVS